MSNLTQLSKSTKCLRPEFSVSSQIRYLQATFLAVGPLNIICVFLSFILNLLVIVAVYKKRRLRRSSTYLLCSLNIKDLILITILQSFAVYRSFNYSITSSFCTKTPIDTTRAFLIFLYRSVSLTTMVLISIDRWIAVWKPSSYRSVFTMRRIIAATILVWLVSVAISCVATYVIEPKHRYQLVFIQFGVTVIIVSGIQISVYFGIKKHGKKIVDASSSHRRQIAIERSIAIIVLYIIVALVICYIPLLVFSAIRFLKNQNYFILASPWMEWLLYINAVANPIIWIKTNSHVKKAVIDVLLSCFKLGSNSNESVDMTEGSRSRHQQSSQETGTQNTAAA